MENEAELQALVITLSDRASSGEYEDKSGALCKELLAEFLDNKQKTYNISRTIIPDSAEQLRSHINKAVQDNTSIIITTGGTGIGSRDITPETIKPLLDKEITGIMELVRVKYGMQNPNAVISRSIAGTIGRSLIYALPGSPKAVTEYMAEICPTIIHSLKMLHGEDGH